MSQMTEIRVEDIIPDPQQPRKTFDEVSLEELAGSIRKLGLIQPITVRRSGDKYMIISGERRFRAAQLAQIETLPAYVREAGDDQIQAMALVENIQREDLNAIEVAMGMQRLIDECGLTQDSLAETLGKKRSTVANFLRLLKLPDEIQKAVKEGYITMGHAKAMASLPSPARQLSALRRCLKHGLSVRGTEELVRHMTEVKETKVNSPADDEYPESYTRLVEYLEKFFSQDISIRRTRNGGGKITIDFSSDADIDAFIARFKAVK